MKKILFFVCLLTMPTLQAMQFQSLKHLGRAVAFGAAVGNSIGLIKKEQSTKPEYSVNLMWINKTLQKDQQYVFPSQWRAESNFDTKNFNTVFKWESLNPGTPIHIWFDSHHLPTQAITNTNALIQDHAEKKMGIINTCEYSFKTDTHISLKDVRVLPEVKNNPEIFSDKTPVYFRGDILRPTAAIHTLSTTKDRYFVYADLDVNPIPENELLDESTLKTLEEYGIVMAKGGHLGFENSFQIISNNNPNLLKAMYVALIELNIKRADLALKGEFNNINGRYDGMCPLQQIVYDSYPGMFKYFYSLEGFGKLQAITYNPTSQIWDNGPYDPLKDGLEPFGLEQYGRGPDLMIENEKIQKKIFPNGRSFFERIFVPTKNVSGPSPCMNYE